MRLPFPIRIPLLPASCAAAVLLVTELYQGTDATFALFGFGFIFVSVLAFNHAGGFSATSGGYVFFFSMLTLVLGLVTKAAVGEPAESHLAQPLLTIELYFVTVCGVYGAVVVSKLLRRSKALLPDLARWQDYPSVIWGTCITGVAVTLVIYLSARDEGTIVSALNQINKLLPLSILFGITYNIRATQGKRLLSVPVVISAVVIFAGGVVGFSKEGMFLPATCILLAAAANRFSFRGMPLTLLIGLLWLTNSYLVPYSQLGRRARVEGGTLADNIDTAKQQLANISQLRTEYAELGREGTGTSPLGLQSYYGQPVGILDRLQMVSADDALINRTVAARPIGPALIFQSLYNVLPHFIAPDKLSISLGNIYAHEVGGIIGDYDDTTGISFSAVSEAYHLLGWPGNLFLVPAVLCVLFVITDSLSGDLRTSPWGLLYLSVFAHAAPEGGILGATYIATTLTAGIVILSLTMKVLFPAIGRLFSPKQRVSPDGG